MEIGQLAVGKPTLTLSLEPEHKRGVFLFVWSNLVEVSFWVKRGHVVFTSSGAASATPRAMKGTKQAVLLVSRFKSYWAQFVANSSSSSVACFFFLFRTSEPRNRIYSQV